MPITLRKDHNQYPLRRPEVEWADHAESSCRAEGWGWADPAGELGPGVPDGGYRSL